MMRDLLSWIQQRRCGSHPGGRWGRSSSWMVLVLLMVVLMVLVLLMLMVLLMVVLLMMVVLSVSLGLKTAKVCVV